MAKNNWTANDIPDQSGRVAIITGANSGLGWETSKALVAKRAHVVMACRAVKKGETAAQEIRQVVAGASLEVAELDLASLDSVRRFVARFQAQHERLDLLINNAGVMAIPYRKTAEGFEMQLGTNHFGHFALTGLLLDLLIQTEGSRIVNVSSGLHRSGTMDFDDLMWEKEYDKWGAYGRSKLANLLFTYEMHRKLDAAGIKAPLSTAAHPGYAATNLQFSDKSLFQKISMAISNFLLAQPASGGALPQLYAATAADVVGGGYYGPDGFQEARGNPVKVDSNAESKNEADAAKLWALSEELTGVPYEQLSVATA